MLKSKGVTFIFAFLLLSGLGYGQERFTVFPQLAVGGGWDGDFSVINQGYGDAFGITMEFFGDNGQPLDVQVQEGVSGDAQTAQTTIVVFSLGPGESRVFRVSRAGQTTPGYVILTWPESASIRATLVYRFAPGGLLQTLVGVPQQFPGSDFSFSAKVSFAERIRTAIAIANGRFPLPATPIPRQANFVISLINPDGTVRETRVLTLGAGEHISLFLDDTRLFGSGINGFSGTVSVSAGVDFGLVVLRLEDERILTSLAIDEGPIFSAFDTSSAIPEIEEVEPNDNFPEAQTLQLPAKITLAEVEEPFATDLYRFEGQAGNILTAYVLTDDQSDLDSYLTLELPDGTLIAYSDQNGLFFRNDSFIRMVLPVSGIYLIRVEDFFFDGGPTFDYTLIVKVENPPGG